ncbi:MAG: hypothetical protein NMNS02_18040 [Nitrosomonas sp.]|nr:MAG: hypothetical protein NMNS02_18040 [Nitrosomonas sp.]
MEQKSFYREKHSNETRDITKTRNANNAEGAVGDRINLLMAACAWNLKQWLVAIFWLFFPSENMAKIRIAS